MNPLAINTVGEELEASAAFCRAQGIGIEVTDFAFPWARDEDSAACVLRLSEAVIGVAPLISHGPFFDLMATSPDPAIVAVARQRHNVALAATKNIGASYYVAHANFNPLIRDSSYRKNWVKRMLEFWLPMADEAARFNLIICLENLWEPGPEIQEELVAAGNHPFLRASFDNGHALIFSKIAAGQWVRTLGPYLAHCHLHDNSGETDEHKPVGEGKENWPDLVKALKKHAPYAVLIAESDQLKSNQASISRLKGLMDQY